MARRLIFPRPSELRAHAEAAQRRWQEEPDIPIIFQQPANSFRDAVRRPMMYRTPFLTSYGLAGICWETCKPGDEVWFLEGTKVPYVLRPINSEIPSEGEGGEPRRYQLCGECYVHGAMEGELLKGKDKKTLKALFSEILLV